MALGTIHLPFTLTSHGKTRWKLAVIHFVIIRHPVEHNIILGRTNLFMLRAIPSTIHGIVKFNTMEGSRTILAIPPRELWCYKIIQTKEIMKEDKKPWLELRNGCVVINMEYSDQLVRIRIHLSPATRQELIKLLKKYKHVFAWRSTYMIGVSIKVIKDKLMIKLRNKEVKQKNCVQVGDTNRAINAEVAKLTMWHPE